MKFCIATIAFWESVGFDTEHWRKSNDGMMAMCHDKFAKALVDINNNQNVQVYDIDSEEFKTLIEEEWMVEFEER